MVSSSSTTAFIVFPRFVPRQRAKQRRTRTAPRPKCGRCGDQASSRSFALHLLRQLDLGQPEIVDALYEVFEGIQLHRFVEVTVRLKLIASHDVRFRIGRGQDDRGDQFQALIFLDVSQDLATVHFRQVQIQQDEIGAGSVNVDPLVPQESHGLHAVDDHVQLDGFVGFAKGFLRQPDIAGAVFDQENLYGHATFSDKSHDFLSLRAKAKRKVDPCPSFDSTEMLLPCRSTIFLQMANPIPVPANSSRLCRRWNIPKILSKYCGSMPNPLSFTAKSHCLPPFLAAEMCTRGTPDFWYLMALPTRF